MSWPGIPRAAACVTHLMQGDTHRKWETGRDAAAKRAGRTYRICAEQGLGGGRGEGIWVHVIPAWCSCLYTPIIESLQPSEKSLCSLWQTDLGQKGQTEGGNGDRKHGWWGGEEAAIENGVNIGLDPYWAASRLQRPGHRLPFLCFRVVDSFKKESPSFLKSNPDFFSLFFLKGSECTPKQISKCGAQWPHCWDHPHRVCGLFHHPHLFLLCLHGCISQAQMGFSAMRSRAWHVPNNGERMTSQLHMTVTASADMTPFFFLFLKWRNMRGSVTH